MRPYYVWENCEQTHRQRKKVKKKRKFRKKTEIHENDKEIVLTGSCGWGWMPGRDGLAVKR